MERTTADELEYDLLGKVLDGLDQLYDDAFGPQRHSSRRLERLLAATSTALAGTSWERPLGDAASRIRRVQSRHCRADDKALATLAATEDLRTLVADRWGDLDSMTSSAP